MRRSPHAKSVSLTALVGGDDRIREAHRESVRVALQGWSGNTGSHWERPCAGDNRQVRCATFGMTTARPCRRLCCAALILTQSLQCD